MRILESKREVGEVIIYDVESKHTDRLSLAARRLDCGITERMYTVKLCYIERQERHNFASI